MLQMSSMMNEMGGLGGFPPPGLTGMPAPAPNAADPTASATSTPSPNSTAPGAGGAAANPNPLFDPAMLQLMNSLGGGGTGAGTGMPGLLGSRPFGLPPFGGLGAAASPSADPRPPEERFEVQLQVCPHCESRPLPQLTSSLSAITRYGFHKRITECSSIVGYRW
jgi:hypothetical protein